ncbi:MAG TPA: SRPBCC domain-containing protein, partial [Hellea balneolensis]|nr:SRPBCC domain-containing protein [Hellea balneolensis]
MSNTTLVKTIFIDAPPQAVWEYLTNKDKLGEWFHPADVSLEENGDYALMGDKG